MFDGRWRSTIEQGLRPIGAGLRRTGITADVITSVGLGMAVATAGAIGRGDFRLALLLLVLTGIPDALDGAVAKASGTSSKRGAFFASVADRVTDGLLLGGVAWYLAPQGRIVLLPFAVAAVAMLVSYQRARAESLGFDARGGLMERAERIIVLAFGLLFSEWLVAVLWVMLVLTAVTAVQRFVKVWRQADRPTPTRTRYRRSRPRPRRPVAERWRDERAARRARP